MLELSYSLNRLRFHNDAALRKVIRRHFQFHFSPWGQPGKTQSSPAGDKCQQPVSIRQFHPIRLVRERLEHYTFNFDGTLSGHVKISGSSSVISTVCSKWADNEPS